ncbi:putative mitochondrial carrier domain-containing protein [Rosa chinensis]|uniref:Putative mitochondrial carrier domain-containing protein n=1 Tax=Rosa chinensis TaxID=74649 RepID=A0A2P6P6X8_ROSCH|nr:uncharacterized protein LOC112179268 [Rosa chinensis]PRQ17685.1 putative mitochondrial carrier domain-containing protein [Rosa chinensis]
MAKCNKPQKNDQPSIKYRWYSIGQASSGLDNFVHERSAVTVSRKSNEQGNRKSQHKSPEILSTTELISAVGHIWDYASRPLGLFQPKANSDDIDSNYRKEVIISGLDGEALISENSGNLSVNLRNSDKIPTIPQPSLDITQVSQKISVFGHCSKSYYQASFWRLLDGGANVPKDSWKGKGLASLEVSYQLGSMYGWMNEVISSGANRPVKAIEIENRNDQCCIPAGTVTVAGSSISGETTRVVDDLARTAVSNPAPVKSGNLYKDDDEKLEINTRTSLYSDYFLVVGEADDIISRSPCSNLHADYHLDSLTSCGNEFEECLHKIDDHDLLDNKKKQAENFVIPDGCKVQPWALARDKPHTSLAKQEHAFAGALSGIFVSICLHPVDTIKTVIQSCRAEQKSIWYIGKSIVSDRGLTGLYRGIATNVASSAPISAVYTFTYESVKGSLLPLFPKEYYSFAHCVAGGCASIATSFIFTPSERIKQQMQVGSQFHNCWNALVGIIQKGGLTSLYAGWGAVLCRNVPHSIVKFYTYESLKKLMLSAEQSSNHPTKLQTLVCGGLAGSTAALFTTPFDVVKTRMQTQIPGSVSQYNSVIHALQEIGKKEGLKGLYRGLTPRLVMYMSQGALFFASYEFFKRSFSLVKQQPKAHRIQHQQNMEDDPVTPSTFPRPSSTSPRLHSVQS